MPASSLPASLTSKLRALDLGGEAVGVRFLGTQAVFALATGEIVLADGENEQRLAAHNGTILSVAGDARRVLTGGDDGRVVATKGDGTFEALFEQKGRWIDQVASGPDGAVAFSAGKTAHFRPGKGEAEIVRLPSTVGGLAFAPKGTRLAVAHYGGAEPLVPQCGGQARIPGMEGLAPRRHLASRGALPRHHHAGAGAAWLEAARGHAYAHERLPLARALHGVHRGRALPRHLGCHRGDPLAVRLQGWADGQAADHAGAARCRASPRSPRIPRTRWSVVGYEDGLALMVRIADAAEILIRAPGGGAVTALAWRPDGGAVAIGTEDGKGGLLVL